MRDNIEPGEMHEDGYSPEENYHLINFVQKYIMTCTVCNKAFLYFIFGVYRCN